MLLLPKLPLARATSVAGPVFAVTHLPLPFELRGSNHLIPVSSTRITRARASSKRRDLAEFLKRQWPSTFTIESSFEFIGFRVWGLRFMPVA